MKEIIEWCNENQGFLSAVLSVATILISALSMRLAYVVGKMPYRKSISMTPFLMKKEDEYVIDVLVVNTGLVDILIESINITNNSGHVIGMAGCGEIPEVLLPNSFAKFQIIICDDIEMISKNAMNLNNHIKIILNEYNGKKHERHKGFPVG